MDVYERTTFENTHAISFDGQDDYITIAGSEDFYVSDNMLSIVAWVNIPDGDQGNAMLIEGWSGYGYHVYITAVSYTHLTLPTKA